jgi:hypothetical protein
MRYVKAIVVSICALCSGCASMFMNGGKLVKGTYAPPIKASFQIPSCTLQNGTPIAPPPSLRIDVVQEGAGLGLFEHVPGGAGAVFTNQWSDAKGDHYFAWVKSSGWEYVIAKDPAGQSMRLVYVNLETHEEGGVTKPVSPLSATCPLLAIK